MDRSREGPSRGGGVADPAVYPAGLCGQAGAGPGLRLRLALHLRRGAWGPLCAWAGPLGENAGGGPAENQPAPGGVPPRLHGGSGVPQRQLPGGAQFAGAALRGGLPRPWCAKCGSGWRPAGTLCLPASTRCSPPRAPRTGSTARTGTSAFPGGPVFSGREAGRLLFGGTRGEVSPDPYHPAGDTVGKRICPAARKRAPAPGGDALPAGVGGRAAPPHDAGGGGPGGCERGRRR